MGPTFTLWEINVLTMGHRLKKVCSFVLLVNITVNSYGYVGHYGGAAKALLVKDGSNFYAVGSKCTYYGAPLEKGMRYLLKSLLLLKKTIEKKKIAHSGKFIVFE